MSDISDVLYQQRGIKHLRLVLPSREYLHTHLAELMDAELTSNTYSLLFPFYKTFHKSHFPCFSTFTLAYLNMTKGSDELSNLLLEQEPTCNVIFNPPNFDQLQQFLRKVPQYFFALCYRYILIKGARTVLFCETTHENCVKEPFLF